MNYDTLNLLVEQGLSSYKIAKSLNLSQTNIRYWLKKHNLKTVRSTERGQVKTHKNCTGCLLTLPVFNFYGRQSRCKKCCNEATTERFQKYKQDCVDFLGGKCSKCGYSKCAAALEFHHLDPSEKDFEISKSNKPLNSVKKELSKCILVCSNCHKEIHFKTI